MLPAKAGNEESQQSKACGAIQPMGSMIRFFTNGLLANGIKKTLLLIAILLPQEKGSQQQRCRGSLWNRDLRLRDALLELEHSEMPYPDNFVRFLVFLAA